MTKIMRQQAILLLAEDDLKKLSAKERADQLFTLSVEDWSDDDGWNRLDPGLCKEIMGGKIVDPDVSRFDQALLIPLAYSYVGVTNEFLLSQVKKKREDIQRVEGKMEVLICCPCCGYPTIEERGNYEICTICWWEDDGQDNKNASNASGPNGGVSLTMGRMNFLRHGIYDPKRIDLLPKRDSTDKYNKGRYFFINKTDQTICERDTEWKSVIGSIE